MGDLASRVKAPDREANVLPRRASRDAQLADGRGAHYAERDKDASADAVSAQSMEHVVIGFGRMHQPACADEASTFARAARERETECRCSQHVQQVQVPPVRAPDAGAAGTCIRGLNA
jgi:hypothetical protein